MIFFLNLGSKSRLKVQNAFLYDFNQSLRCEKLSQSAQSKIVAAVIKREKKSAGKVTQAKLRVSLVFQLIG